jgi:hypothetical protein
METIRWGIIGVGNVCEKKSGPAFYKIEHSELVAVMRRDEAKVKDYASRHQVKKYYTDADALINEHRNNGGENNLKQEFNWHAQTEKSALFKIKEFFDVIVET